MLKRDNIMHFIMFNYKPLEKRQIYKSLIILWLSSIVTTIYGQLKETLIPIFIIVDLLYTCLCIKALCNRIVEQEAKFLIDGFLSLFLSIIGIIASYKIASFSLKSSSLSLLLILFILLIIDITIFVIIVCNNIKADKYSGRYTNSKIFIYAFIGAVAGNIAARIYLPKVNASFAPLIISSCILLISFVLVAGSLNLLRYCFWKSIMK